MNYWRNLLLEPDFCPVTVTGIMGFVLPFSVIDQTNDIKLEINAEMQECEKFKKTYKARHGEI